MRVFEVEFNCTKQSYTVTIEYFSQSLSLGQQYPKSFIETTIQELSRSKKLYTIPYAQLLKMFQLWEILKQSYDTLYFTIYVTYITGIGRIGEGYKTSDMPKVAFLSYLFRMWPFNTLLEDAAPNGRSRRKQKAAKEKRQGQQKAMASSIWKAIYVLPINLLNTLALTNTIFTSNCCTTGPGRWRGCPNKKLQCVYFSVEFCREKAK